MALHIGCLARHTPMNMGGASDCMIVIKIRRLSRSNPLSGETDLLGIFI